MGDIAAPPPAPCPQTPVPASRGLISLLSEADFRRVWIAGGVFGTIRWLEMLSVGIYVFDLTGSPFQVALMTFVRMVPMLLFGTIVGALAERLNRKWLLAGGLAVLSAVSALLWILALTGTIALWHIALGAFFNGIFWATDFPVRRTLLGEIAGTERMSSAMGTDAATNHATRVFGPVMGGLILDTIGLEGTYLFGAVLFAIAAMLVLGLRVGRPIARTSEWSVFANIVEGFRYIRSNRFLLGILAVTVIFNFWGFAFSSLAPVVGREVLRLSAFTIGLLLSTEAVGATLTAVAVAVVGPKRHHTEIYVGGTMVFLLGVLLFSLSHSLVFSLAALFVAGCGLAGFSAMQGTITLLAAPPDMRARVMGAVTLGIGIGPIGTLHVGFLADMFGAAMAITIIAAEGLIALGATLLIWPELRRRGAP